MAYKLTVYGKQSGLERTPMRDERFYYEKFRDAKAGLIERLEREITMINAALQDARALRATDID